MMFTERDYARNGEQGQRPRGPTVVATVAEGVNGGLHFVNHLNQERTAQAGKKFTGGCVCASRLHTKMT